MSCTVSGSPLRGLMPAGVGKSSYRVPTFPTLFQRHAMLHSMATSRHKKAGNLPGLGGWCHLSPFVPFCPLGCPLLSPRLPLGCPLGCPSVVLQCAGLVAAATIAEWGAVPSCMSCTVWGVPLVACRAESARIRLPIGVLNACFSGC